MDEFAQKLIQADAAMLERGDYVYERIKWGMSPSEVKYKRWRVRSTERDVALVTDPDRPRDNARKIRLGDLWMEPVHIEPKRDARGSISSLGEKLARKVDRDSLPVVARSLKTAEPAKVVVDEDLAAWLEMGRGMLDGIDRTESELAAQKESLQSQLAEVDRRHQQRIDAIEQDLTEARKEHADDRAFVAARIEGLERRLQGARERRQQIGQMLGKDGG